VILLLSVIGEQAMVADGTMALQAHCKRTHTTSRVTFVAMFRTFANAKCALNVFSKKFYELLLPHVVLQRQMEQWPYRPVTAEPAQQVVLHSL